MSTLAIFIQHSFEVLATTIEEEKEIKGVQIRKEEVKLSDDMMTWWHDVIHRKS